RGKRERRRHSARTDVRSSCVLLFVRLHVRIASSGWTCFSLPISRAVCDPDREGRPSGYNDTMGVRQRAANDFGQPLAEELTPPAFKPYARAALGGLPRLVRRTRTGAVMPLRGG